MSKIHVPRPLLSEFIINKGNSLLVKICLEISALPFLHFKISFFFFFGLLKGRITLLPEKADLPGQFRPIASQLVAIQPFIPPIPFIAVPCLSPEQHSSLNTRGCLVSGWESVATDSVLHLPGLGFRPIAIERSVRWPKVMF